MQSTSIASYRAYAGLSCPRIPALSPFPGRHFSSSRFSSASVAFRIMLFSGDTIELSDTVLFVSTISPHSIPRAVSTIALSALLEIHARRSKVIHLADVLETYADYLNHCVRVSLLLLSGRFWRGGSVRSALSERSGRSGRGGLSCLPGGWDAPGGICLNAQYVPGAQLAQFARCAEDSHYSGDSGGVLSDPAGSPRLWEQPLFQPEPLLTAGASPAFRVVLAMLGEI